MILKKVRAYDEKIIIKKDVFVKRVLSKVPVVCDCLTSLLKIFREENIKSTAAMFKNTIK